MHRQRRLIILLAAALLSAACGTAVPLDDQAGRVKDGSGDGRPPMPEPPRPCCVNPDRLRKPPHQDPASVLAQRSVYFGLDQYSVPEQYTALLEVHGRYLAAHPKLRVVIEGHADRRGSREYNVALGQRRADAVRRVLQLHGVASDQIEPVSYGAERPAAEGDDEAAWAKNRRAEIRYID